MIYVVNRKNFQEPSFDFVSVYIGRPSALGNPFKIGDGVTRQESLERYRIYLNDRIKKRDENIIKELNRIYEIALSGVDVYLVCHCKPKPCHGDYLKHILDRWTPIKS